jgi:hypothetical protein
MRLASGMRTDPASACGGGAADAASSRLNSLDRSVTRTSRSPEQSSEPAP